MSPPLRTVIVGFGAVADTLGDDPRMRRHFVSSSHAQVLDSHPAYSWDAVVDPSPVARERARDVWHIRHVVAHPAELNGVYDPEVLVVTAPPRVRSDLVERFPSLRGLMVEKPVGLGQGEGERLLESCGARGLPVQVNLWRRAVPRLHELAAGGLSAMAGEPQAAFGVYGNGFFNNGTHLIDLARMLFGEVIAVQAVCPLKPSMTLPIVDDMQVDFALHYASGFKLQVAALDFAHYREVGLDIWGTRGRISLMQETLSEGHFPRSENRGLVDEMEIASDRGQFSPLEVEQAFRHLYDNLHAVIEGGEVELLSSARSALRSEFVRDQVLVSLNSGGANVPVHGATL